MTTWRIRLFLLPATFQFPQLPILAHKTLQRVLSRTKVAGLSEDAARDLANSCIHLIEFSRPRLYVTDEFRFGRAWVERMRVAMEVLSRLVSRLDADMASSVFSLGLECFGDRRMAQDAWLAGPIGNLLRRSWQTLPQGIKSERVFELLMAPIVGIDGFDAFEYSVDIGSLIQNEDLPPADETSWDARSREAVAFLIRGLRNSNASARNQAIGRMLPLAASSKFSDAEESEVASVLWQDNNPVIRNAPGTGSPADWVFMLLPEIEPGQANQSFRNKWLNTELDEPFTDDATSMAMLGQIGSAIAGLRFRNVEFPLSNDESELIGQNIFKLVIRYSRNTVTTISSDQQGVIRNLGAIGATISISEQLANELFDETRNLVEGASAPPGTSLRQFLQFSYSFGTAVGYGAILCLVKALPDRIETIDTWLTTAFASSDEAKVRSAMKTVRDWVSTPENPGLLAVPDNLIREIGAIIASRRRDALADALWCSVSIFSRGTARQREVISLFAQHGLVYLAEEMNYHLPQHEEDVPTIRFLCVQLAASMANNGYESLAGVQMWLSIGRSDPFPEVRNEVGFWSSEDESETEEYDHGMD